MSSSPFTSPGQPGRERRSLVPASSPGSFRNPIALEDEDDDDHITDSSTKSSPYFAQPAKIVDRKTLGGPVKGGTQPTQIVDRKTLGPTKIGSGSSLRDASVSPSSDRSSPASKVEVPRSSPFKFKSSPLQPQMSRPRGGIFAGMGPAGTSFLPPPKIKSIVPDKTENRAENRKLSIQESSDELSRSARYNALSDSSSSDRPAHGDIQRSSFQRQAPSPQKAEPRPAQHQAEFETFDSRTQLKARKLHKKLGGRRSLLLCARALAKTRDMDSAYNLLTNPDQSSSLVTSASVNSVSSKRSSPSGSPAPVQAPEPKRRRLVRGRNGTGTSKQSSTTSLINLVESEDDEKLSTDKEDGDNYEADSESEQSQNESGDELVKTNAKSIIGLKRTTKILQYLQSCEIDSLAADAKISKDDAKYMISKRPFYSIDQVKGTHQFKLTRKRKERVNIGENVFDELNRHIKRLSAIDRVVEQCETQGQIINAKVSGWKMDQLGKVKGSVSASLSPSALLPFPKEPKSIKGSLYPYQLYGMNWMWQLYTRGYGGILADDMGLGKTCQVISFMALLIDAYKAGVLPKSPGPNLVVVPASVLANWQNEFAKFAPGLSIVKFSGSPTVRAELAAEISQSAEEYDVILTSYSQVSRTKDAKLLNRIGINAAIFDEGHKLKNPEANIYRDLILIDAKWKLLITGTPIQNNIMEMITLLNFISPKLFHRDRECFEELFVQKASLKEVSEGATLLSDRIQRARSILEPFILQRKKEQVLSNLPPKTRKVVYVEMPDQQKAAYEEKVASFRRCKTEKITGGRKNDDNNPWIQLRKAATHPQLFRRFFDDVKCEKMAKLIMKNIPQDILRQPELAKMTEELKKCSDFELHLWCRDYDFLSKFDCPAGSWFESGKVAKLLELLEDYRRNGDRVLVFSKFRKVLDILEECLGQEAINYRVLDGTTKVADRQVLVDEFQEDESISAFLLTTEAGGQGINLTASNKIIIFDQSDNPQQDVQAENRAHRLGQKREVEVIRLISKGTIDELIYKACQKKLELAGHITGFSEDIGEAELVTKVTEQLMNGEGDGEPSDRGYITPPKSDQ